MMRLSQRLSKVQAFSLTVVALSLFGELGLVDVVFSLTHGLSNPMNRKSKGHKMSAVPFYIDPSAMNLVTRRPQQR